MFLISVVLVLTRADTSSCAVSADDMAPICSNLGKAYLATSLIPTPIPFNAVPAVGLLVCCPHWVLEKARGASNRFEAWLMPAWHEPNSTHAGDMDASLLPNSLSAEMDMSLGPDGLAAQTNLADQMHASPVMLAALMDKYETQTKRYETLLRLTTNRNGIEARTTRSAQIIRESVKALVRKHSLKEGLKEGKIAAAQVYADEQAELLTLERTIPWVMYPRIAAVYRVISDPGEKSMWGAKLGALKVEYPWLPALTGDVPPAVVALQEEQDAAAQEVVNLATSGTDVERSAPFKNLNSDFRMRACASMGSKVNSGLQALTLWQSEPSPQEIDILRRKLLVHPQIRH